MRRIGQSSWAFVRTHKLSILRWIVILALFGGMGFIYRRILRVLGIYFMIAFLMMLGYIMAMFVGEAIGARLHTYGRILRTQVTKRYA